MRVLGKQALGNPLCLREIATGEVMARLDQCRANWRQRRLVRRTPENQSERSPNVRPGHCTDAQQGADKCQGPNFWWDAGRPFSHDVTLVLIVLCQC